MEQIKLKLNEVFLTHQYILGPHVRAFELMIQDYLDVNHSVGCASGTDALVLALKALDIGRGDEVITTPFTFFATASSIVRAGAKPVFVDIKADTFNIDPQKIEEAITPKTRAVMPVHLFGQPAEMDLIMDIARRHNLAVIEDNAQGIGSLYEGKKAGTIGDIGTLSFFPSKNLGCMGDGGMCLTNNEDLANKLKQLRVHGENPKYYHKWIGLNSRLDSIQAAVLAVKLPYLEGWSEKRRENAKYYYANMQNVEEIKLPYIVPEAQTIYNQFTIIAEKRDELKDHLSNAGIGYAIYYPLPLHLQECFAYLEGNEGDCPNAEMLAEKVISLPIYPELKPAQLDYVIENIKEFYRN
jgi:dTDP-4-amino-4,6-dideoxygalactose transaminase